jgi:hypothetical protein
MNHLRSMTAEDLLHTCRSLNWIAFPLVADGLSMTETKLDCKVTVDFGNINNVPLINEDTNDDSIAVLIGDTEAEVCGPQSPFFNYLSPNIYPQANI